MIFTIMRVEYTSKVIKSNVKLFKWIMVVEEIKINKQMSVYG